MKKKLYVAEISPYHLVKETWIYFWIAEFVYVIMKISYKEPIGKQGVFDVQECEVFQIEDVDIIIG